nr:pheromone gland-specific fatty acyl reductase [Maruca vitrata]
MFGGTKGIATFTVALTQSCRRNLKPGFIASAICRNQSTVIENSNDQQSVADFYAGKSVFITGGTGFLGKVFIEKLLYSCKDIDKVFILIRDKKGESTPKRLQQMLNNRIFDRVKKTNPNAFSKVIPIIGDISEPNLGIKPEDEQKLIDAVSVVFHSAATVKFFEPLKVAMNINFEGTRRMINLSKRMKKLHNFVYISTAYSQTIYPVLEERVYSAPAKVEDVYKFIEKYNFDVKKTNKFIANRPNTYTFTKAMSENYAGTCPDIPVTIVRPSLVGATINEPYPGWLDNWFAMTAPAIDVARGLNRHCLTQPQTRCDVIPVDYVTNLSVIAGAKYNGGNGVPVYNSTSGGTNPITWSQVFDKFIAESRKHNICISEPSVVYNKSKFIYELSTLLFQKTPAYASDLMLRLKGDKPRHVDLLRRALMTRHSMEYFLQDWTTKADKARALYASLSKADQEEFPCDPADINWESYLTDYFEGVRTHLLPRQLEKERAAYGLWNDKK